jgi:hypothetical protein
LCHDCLVWQAILEEHFDRPMHVVCKKLGICASVIKKVSRQLLYREYGTYKTVTARFWPHIRQSKPDSGHI